MPWEITTLSNLTPDHSHPVSLYGKSGGAQSYRSQVTIVPEYGIAIVVLTAGSMHALPSVLDAVIGTVLPVVDAVARAQAREHYARTFSTADRQDSSAHPNYQVVIEQDEDSLILGPVTATVECGESKPLNDALKQIWTMILGEYTGNAIGPTVRLFPTAIETERLLPGEPTPVRGEVWRLWPDLQASMPTSGTGLPHAGLVSGQECMTWSVGDWVHYGGEPLDRVVFFRDENGQVLGMEMPFLRTGVLYVGN
jgi:actin-related protein 6